MSPEAERHPPRLLVKTLAVSFATVALVLSIVFIVVTVSVRAQVRQAVATNLESSQRMFAALEARRQHELQAEAAILAENPTLKAALDTYQAESATSSPPQREQLLNTIDGEMHELQARIDADAIVLVDTRQRALAATGRMADRWPRGRPVALVGATDRDRDHFDGVTRVGASVFRVVTVPLRLDDGSTIGTLYLSSILDQHYAEELATLAGTKIAIASEGLTIGSTLPPAAAREFEARVASNRLGDGTVVLDGEAHAYRRLVDVGDTSLYALGSIDDASRTATRSVFRSLTLIAAGAGVLALCASFVLAQMLSGPIGQLSQSLSAMTTSRQHGTLPRTGSSRELDALTDTFNALMASVAEAEAQTQAAYTGAIRALATALDARDPYTAGHSERVSVLSVAIGRALQLPPEEVEVLRLGALLHDIGKIGVPDDVLRKPGPLTDAEYAAIKLHPVLGARILRSVPFLAPHLPIVELHHERPDGGGYPHGLRGDDIPLAARIVHVADAYDAITSARAYRSARPSGDALKELWRCAGTAFHAEIVGALVSALPGVTSDAPDMTAESVSA